MKHPLNKGQTFRFDPEYADRVFQVIALRSVGAVFYYDIKVLTSNSQFDKVGHIYKNQPLESQTIKLVDCAPKGHHLTTIFR